MRPQASYLVSSSLSYLALITTGQAIVQPNSSGLTVDLGYGIYTGLYNTTTKLAVWKG